MLYADTGVRAAAIPRSAVDAQVAKRLYEWIVECLGKLRQPKSTAVIAGAISSRSDSPTPCIFLSLPEPEKYVDAGIAPPLDIALHISCSQYSPLVDSGWQAKIVGAADSKLNLCEMSLGAEGDYLGNGGSFAGWLINEESDKIYGFTCAHCAPNAVPGTRIVSPSAYEVSNVLQNHRAHTTYTEENRQWPVKAGKEAYIKALLRTFKCEPPVDYDDFEATAKGVKSASGQVIGTVVARASRRTKEILSKFDQELRDNRLQEFGANPEHTSTMDWILFEATTDRVGFNVFSEGTESTVDPDEIPVLQIGHAVEMLPVRKIGRSTGNTMGSINGFNGVVWDMQGTAPDLFTEELVIANGGESDRQIFASTGDSGAAVVTFSDPAKEPVVGKAKGMIHGRDKNFTFFTPIQSVIEDMRMRTGMPLKWLDTDRLL